MKNYILKIDEITVLLLLSLTIISCQNDKNNEAKILKNNTEITNAEKNEEQVILEALQNEKYFTEVSQIGIERANNPELKELSSKLRNKHFENSENLKSISEERGYKIPEKLSEDFQTRLYKFTMVNTSDFDKYFQNNLSKDYKDRLDTIAKKVNENLYEDSHEILTVIISKYNTNFERLDKINLGK